MTFLKNYPRPCVMLKQVFLDRFELVVAHFALWSSENPKMPRKWAVLGPKMGQKCVKSVFFQTSS